MLIITHSGLFHAEEVFAIAALIKWSKTYLNVSVTGGIFPQQSGYHVVRTRDCATIKTSLSSERIYVIDVGKTYASNMLNFDHQDQNKQASNILVFKHLLAENKIDKDVYGQLLPFMEGIGVKATNAISGFNRDLRDEELQNKQFKLAVEFALTMLNNAEYSAIQCIEAQLEQSQADDAQEDTD